MRPTKITISGDPGSGKSSVARRLADSLGFRILSTGQLHRDIAASLGLSTLEANLRAETDEGIDSAIDSQLIAVGEEPDDVIFDSRLAWHFVSSAFKIHLIVDEHVGANRAFGDGERISAIEHYQSQESALHAIRERQDSERRRFLDKYQIDICRLRNYDLVIDTTEASAEDVAELVVSIFLGGVPDTLGLYVAPKRVFPTTDTMMELGRAIKRGVYDTEDVTDLDPVVVAYARPFVFALDGHVKLSHAIKQGRPLVEAVLEAEDDEKLAGGRRPGEYLREEVRPSWIYDWEEAHQYRFNSYPELTRT